MRAIALILCLLATAAASVAGNARPATADTTTTSRDTRFAAAAPSTVVLDGSSNVADWQCRGSEIDARMLVATTPEHLNAVIDRIEDGNVGAWITSPLPPHFPTPDFTLRIPVAAFKCGNRVMENDMRRALKAEAHPAIEFAFRQVVGGIEHDIDGGVYRARITGDLSLAGATRRLDIPVTAQRVSPARFRLRASLPLRMTEFGVEPPTALFGAIRARDALTVRFDLTLEVRP